MYDSRKDAIAHITIIHDVFRNIVIKELEKRSAMHDVSKLESPEKECYDKYIPMLKETKYGTEEYYNVKKAMEEEGLKHHYEENRHHPEHYPNGIDDMDLFDVVEMFTDWFSASKKSDTSFVTGLISNADRFHISPQLYRIMYNTYERYYKNYK